MQHQSEEKASLGLSLQNEEEFANSSNNLASASDLKPPIPNIHTNGSSSPQRKSIGNESNGTNLRGKDASVSDSSLDNSFSNGMSTSSDGTITSTQSEPTLNVTPFAVNQFLIPSFLKRISTSSRFLLPLSQGPTFENFTWQNFLSSTQA